MKAIINKLKFTKLGMYISNKMNGIEIISETEFNSLVDTTKPVIIL